MSAIREETANRNMPRTERKLARIHHTTKEQRSEGVSNIFLFPSFHRVSIKSNDGPNAEVWIGDSPCLVTIDRPGTVTELPKKELSQPHVLKMMAGKTYPVLKVVLVELTLGQCHLQVRVFITEITDKFILGLDVLRANNASVDLKHSVL
jgi:hypothetical protein